MSGNKRLLVIALVVLIGLGLVYLPQYLGKQELTQEPSETEQGEFVATAEPREKYTEARNAGKPIFLEFYAIW